MINKIKEHTFYPKFEAIFKNKKRRRVSERNFLCYFLNYNELLYKINQLADMSFESNVVFWNFEKASFWVGMG